MILDFKVLLSFFVYVVVMTAIGIYFYFKTKNLSDYVLGGRSLNPTVTALSAGASDMSGWLLLGLPGAMYLNGISSIWIAIGLVFGAFLNWQYIAKPLRVYTQKLNDSLTIPDFFSNRLNDTNNSLRIITAIIILFFFTLYTSSGLVGGAKLFQAVFGLNYFISLSFGSIVIVGYTFLGGFNAVSWTDLFQGLLMMLALIIAPIVIIHDVGGFYHGIELIKQTNSSHLEIFKNSSFIGIVSLLGWGLGYFGQPHILARFMSIKSHKLVPKARNIAMIWMFLSILGSLSVGFFGLVYVKFHNVDLADPEKIFIVLSHLLFSPWISGILLAAILAAIMSTVDSQLLVSSSVLTQDIYHAFFRKKATQKELVWVGRLTVVTIAVIAWIISLDKNSSVLELVSYAWAGFGAAFGPLVILFLYNANITKQGAICGMIVGSIVVVIWKQFDGGIFDLYEIIPGFIFAFFTIICVSKFGSVNQDSKNIFYEIKNILNGK